MTAKEWVLSIYPNAEIQFTASGMYERLVSEPTIHGFWISGARKFKLDSQDSDDDLWESARFQLYQKMLRKLES